ncbi:MAG: 4a-hydroxytetrahydrobiopterin dehydratase, partial [Phycisphaerae bacterium]
MSELAEKKCVPCQGGAAPLTGNALKPLLAQLDGWQIQDEHDLNKQFKFADFQTALDFGYEVGAIAEAEAHHPDLTLTWGNVGGKIW